MKNKEIDKWAMESLPILKKYGYLDKKPSNKPLVAAIFLLGCLFGGILIYGIINDSFKTEINQDIDPNADIDIENQYDFNPKIENEYEMYNNHTIINNIIIPSGICGN